MSRKNFLKIAVCFLLAACCVSVVWAKIKLPAVIGDNMVLQRGVPVHVWGWATPGEEVTVALAGQTVTATAGEDGRWQATLGKLTCGEPLEMTISGKADEKITLKNILVGEVWVCSGQSNMW